MGALVATAFLLGPFLGLAGTTVDETYPRVGIWTRDGRLGSVMDARPADLDLRLPPLLGWEPAARPAWLAPVRDALRSLEGEALHIQASHEAHQRALERLVQQWRLLARLIDGPGFALLPAPELTFLDIVLPRLDPYRPPPYRGAAPPGMLKIGDGWVPAPPASGLPWYFRGPAEPLPAPLVSPADREPVGPVPPPL